MSGHVVINRHRLELKSLTSHTSPSCPTSITAAESIRFQSLLTSKPKRDLRPEIAPLPNVDKETPFQIGKTKTSQQRPALSHTTSLKIDSFDGEFLAKPMTEPRKLEMLRQHPRITPKAASESPREFR